MEMLSNEVGDREGDRVTHQYFLLSTCHSLPTYILESGSRCTELYQVLSTSTDIWMPAEHSQIHQGTTSTVQGKSKVGLYIWANWSQGLRKIDTETTLFDSCSL